jgi:RNA polymerase sigma factor (sigma-70 family)
MNILVPPSDPPEAMLPTCGQDRARNLRSRVTPTRPAIPSKPWENSGDFTPHPPSIIAGVGTGLAHPSSYASVKQSATTAVGGPRDKELFPERAGFEASWKTAQRAAQRRVAIGAKWASLGVNREDLVQEGVTACWRALPQFDPTRASLPTFFDRVVANRLASVLRSSRTPILQPLEAADAYTIDSALGHIHLALDVAKVLERLNENDRRLAKTLMKCSPSETSRRLGISRSTVYARMAGLRSSFIAAGFGPHEARKSEFQSTLTGTRHA